jgi:hypothetical protein
MRSSGTSVHTRTTQRYSPEVRNIHNYRCKNIKSCISWECLHPSCVNISCTIKQLIRLRNQNFIFCLKEEGLINHQMGYSASAETWESGNCNFDRKAWDVCIMRIFLYKISLQMSVWRYSNYINAGLPTVSQSVLRFWITAVTCDVSKALNIRIMGLWVCSTMWILGNTVINFRSHKGIFLMHNIYIYI